MNVEQSITKSSIHRAPFISGRSVVARRIRGWSIPLLSILLVSAFLFPLYWLAVTSFKAESEIFQTPPTFFPHKIYIKSYTEQLLSSSYNIFLGFKNSAIIALGALTISTLLAIPASYGLARFQFAGRHLMLLLFLVTQMLPAALILTPLFIMYKQLGLLGPTYWGTILANATAGIPFSVVILRTYFASLPKELEESAKIDGCNLFTTFLRIMLPIATPGVVVAMVFSFLFAWGDLIYGMTFISKEHMKPITAGIYNFLGFQRTSWNNTMAFGMVSIMPVVLIFIFIQKFIVSGLTNGAVKG
jgi:multiple sugar transport system permease protein